MGEKKVGISFPSSMSGREEGWDLVPILYEWERRRGGPRSHLLLVGLKKAGNSFSHLMSSITPRNECPDGANRGIHFQ